MAMAVGVAAAVQQRRLEQQQPEHDVLLVTQYVFNASRCDVQYVVDFLKSSRHNTWSHHHPVVTKLKFHSWQQQQPASTSAGGGSLFEYLVRFFYEPTNDDNHHQRRALRLQFCQRRSHHVAAGIEDWHECVCDALDDSTNRQLGRCCTRPLPFWLASE
jgi:hypothetical protein